MASMAMKKTHAIQQMKKQVVDKTWGRKVCDPRHDCPLCKHYGHDPQMMLEFRNQYLTGLPADVAMFIVDPDCVVPPADLHRHAFRAQWNYRRKKILEIAVDPAFAFIQVMRRLQKSHNVISDQTGDKMVAHIVEMAGITKKVQIQQKVSFTWEDTLAKADSQTEGDAVFTLEDEDFTDVTEAFQESVEDAEAN